MMLDSAYKQVSFYDSMPSSLPKNKWQKTVNLIAKLFNAPGAWIMQKNTKGIEAVVASTVSKHNIPAGFHFSEETPIYCKQTIQSKQQLYVKNASTENNWYNNPEYTNENFISYLGVPILWPNGSAFGTLCVLDTKETNYSDEYIELIWLLKESIDTDLKNLTLLSTLKLQSISDELTGLNNRRGFIEQASSLISLAQRNKLSLSLMYFDINNLKNLNNKHGHEVGDLLIKSFTKALSKSIRNEDIIARLGGDEFCFLGINSDEYDFITLESRVQANLEKSTMQYDKISNPSFSAGNHLFQDLDNVDIETMLSEVDALMYKDKQTKKIYLQSIK